MTGDHQVSSLQSPLTVSEHVWPGETQPLVSVAMITYNQDKFIHQAIDGVLMQEISFPLELIIGDDCSTDTTRSIVENYASRHPNVIRTILHSSNVGMVSNCKAVMNLCRGKYIALCEGDDYWTCVHKLHQQIELLEMNPSASGCIHRADGRFEETGEIVPGHFGPDVIKPSYTVDDLLKYGNFVPTASVVYRREVLQKLPAGPHSDFLMLVEAAMAGPLLYLPQSMATYRKHGGGVHTGQPTAIQIARSLETLFVIASHFGLAEKPAFNEGVKFRLRQMEEQIFLYEKKIAEQDDRHRDDSQTIRKIHESKTFKVGRALNRFRNQFKLL